MIKRVLLGVVLFGLFSCTSSIKQSNASQNNSEVFIAGAMKNVMWKGALDGTIYLDTISEKEGLFGIGPVRNLRGEILVDDGVSYVSKVALDSTITVSQTFDVAAPFFVYATVNQWNEIHLSSKIKTIRDLENVIEEKRADFDKPFAFKLKGSISSASIHIQNLPEATKVSSPQEAHQGQMNYELKDEEVTIIGFFSTQHKGVFTHHDTHVHLHLMTNDKTKMGHLDDLEMEKMTLYLPTQL